MIWAFFGVVSPQHVKSLACPANQIFLQFVAAMDVFVRLISSAQTIL
jgi:hypothetical protein